MAVSSTELARCNFIDAAFIFRIGMIFYDGE